MLHKYALFKVFAALRNSDGKESVHSTAKKAKVSVSSAKHCLDFLYGQTMLAKEVYGRMYQYSLNLEHPVVRQIKVVFSLQEIMVAGIVDEIKKVIPGVLSIMLFGSVASGKDTPQSDIDIVIISRMKPHKTHLDAEKRIDREVSSHWYSLLDWKKVSLEDKPFYESVVIDGLPLLGEKPVVK